MEAMGLCQADHSLDGLMIDTVRWTIAPKLASALPPFTQLIDAHQHASNDLDEIRQHIHPYWKFTSYYDGKPDGVDEREQIEMVNAANETRELLATIRKEIGRGLALHWVSWLYSATII